MLMRRTIWAVPGTLFECNFDGKTMCGMTAGKEDTIWEVGYDTTPSLDTGPTTAESGSYFMFIEASGKKPHALAR